MIRRVLVLVLFDPGLPIQKNSRLDVSLRLVFVCDLSGGGYDSLKILKDALELNDPEETGLVKTILHSMWLLCVNFCMDLKQRAAMTLISLTQKLSATH